MDIRVAEELSQYPGVFLTPAEIIKIQEEYNEKSIPQLAEEMNRPKKNTIYNSLYILRKLRPNLFPRKVKPRNHEAFDQIWSALPVGEVIPVDQIKIDGDVPWGYINRKIRHGEAVKRYIDKLKCTAISKIYTRDMSTLDKFIITWNELSAIKKKMAKTHIYTKFRLAWLDKSQDKYLNYIVNIICEAAGFGEIDKSVKPHMVLLKQISAEGAREIKTLIKTPKEEPVINPDPFGAPADKTEEYISKLENYIKRMEIVIERQKKKITALEEESKPNIDFSKLEKYEEGL